jgi:hypothetical protein
MGPAWSRRRVALAVVCAAGLIASVTANWPGHFSPDSLWQLAQGRDGLYNTWHPPVTAWLLGLLDGLWRGAPLFIVLQAGLFFGGLFTLAATEPRPRWIAPLLVAILAVLPEALIYQGDVWKDVLFADATVAGFAALAWAGRVWSDRRLRLATLGLALLLFSLAALTRQNGFVVPVCGAASLAFIAARQPAERWAKGRPGLAYGVAALALVGGVCAGASFAFSLSSDGEPEGARQLERLQAYDLAGAVRADPGLPLPVLAREAPDLARFIRLEAAPLYNIATGDTIEAAPGASVRLSTDGRAAGRQWVQLIASRPDLYLGDRAAVFGAVLLTPRSLKCPMAFTGVDAQQVRLLELAPLAARSDAKDRWDNVYAFAFVGTPAFSHLFWGALLLAMLALAARDFARGDRRPELVASAGLGAAALLFTASFFVLSSACDYRYLYLLDVAAMALLVRQAARQPRARPSRSAERLRAGGRDWLSRRRTRERKP